MRVVRSIYKWRGALRLHVGQHSLTCNAHHTHGHITWGERGSFTPINYLVNELHYTKSILHVPGSLEWSRHLRLTVSGFETLALLPHCYFVVIPVPLFTIPLSAGWIPLVSYLITIDSCPDIRHFFLDSLVPYVLCSPICLIRLSAMFSLMSSFQISSRFSIMSSPMWWYHTSMCLVFAWMIGFPLWVKT